MSTAKLSPLENLAAKLVHHQHLKNEQEQIIKGLQAEIRAALGDYKTVPVGNLKVSWTPPSREFDVPRFKSMYPPDLNPGLYKQVPDGDAIAKSLKEQFMVRKGGDGTVTVK